VTWLVFAPPILTELYPCTPAFWQLLVHMSQKTKSAACLSAHLEETRSELFWGKRDWKYGQTCFVMTTVNSSLNSSVLKIYFFHFVTKKKREGRKPWVFMNPRVFLISLFRSCFSWMSKVLIPTVEKGTEGRRDFFQRESHQRVFHDSRSFSWIT
jgi:hypothetical protein